MKMDKALEVTQDYYNAYKNNVEKMFPTKYFHPSSLSWLDRDWERFRSSDQYIAAYEENKASLAKDILANGNYFPFWVYKEEKTGSYIAWEGLHRLSSIRLAMESGLWTDEEVYCVEFTQAQFDAICDMRATNTIYPIEPTTFLIPIQNQLCSDEMMLSGLDSKAMILARNVTKPGPAALEINTLNDAWRICNMYHRFLKNHFWAHEKVLDKRIPSLFPLKKG